jgi:hypothetical protein
VLKGVCLKKFIFSCVKIISVHFESNTEILSLANLFPLAKTYKVLLGIFVAFGFQESSFLWARSDSTTVEHLTNDPEMVG